MSIIRSVVRPMVRSMVRGLTEGIDGFSPLNLSPTVLYDFYDRLSLYTDSAGTTQTRAPGTGGVAGDYSVGKVTDQTAGAYHGTQTTSTAKPAFSARYNLLTYSEVFSNAAWAPTNLLAFGSGSVANTTDTTDPLGGNTADFICENSATGVHTMQQSLPTLPLNTQHTASVYAKAGTGSYLILQTRNESNTTLRTWFNLSAGTVGTSNAGHTATITSAGNGWNRCEVNFDSGASDTTTALCVLGIANADASSSYTGNGTRGIYIWGADVRRTTTATLPAYQSITDALNYDTVGFPPYVSFDLVDDVLPNAVTLPAITGDIWIATTRGLYVAAMSFAGGSFSFGPTTYTGGTAGLLSTIGSRIIGTGVVGYTLTAGQKAQLLAYYQTKGCQGVLL